MKSVLYFFLLIIWMILTIALVVSMIGMYYLMDSDSIWNDIPKKILNTL
jgi:hypothetical protein